MLTFDYLGIDVTRRCNLSCAMCIRGDAQNTDVPLSAIETIAKQADRVNSIVFTGGEPTLNLPAIRYTLESFKKHNVSVKQIEIKTNGVLQTEEITSLVKDWAAYIRPEWRYIGESPVLFSISKDRYHVGADPNAAAEYYTSSISECATILFADSGDRPVRMGRARKFDEAQIVVPLMKLPRKICLWEHGQEPACPDLQEDETKVNAPIEGEIIVVCPLRITATGHLVPTLLHSLEYAAEDEIINEISICDLAESVDVLGALRAWNQRIPSSCEDAYLREYFDMAERRVTAMTTEQKQRLVATGNALKRFATTPIGGLATVALLMGIYNKLKE